MIIHLADGVPGLHLTASQRSVLQDALDPERARRFESVLALVGALWPDSVALASSPAEMRSAPGSASAPSDEDPVDRRRLAAMRWAMAAAAAGPAEKVPGNWQVIDTEFGYDLKRDHLVVSRFWIHTKVQQAGA